MTSFAFRCCECIDLKTVRVESECDGSICIGCDSNEQRKCIETPVKTNICSAATPLFVSLG